MPECQAGRKKACCSTEMAIIVTFVAIVTAVFYIGQGLNPSLPLIVAYGLLLALAGGLLLALNWCIPN
jgi:hypothetical protein